MKASEQQEFRQAKSGVRIEQKLNFLEKIAPKAQPVGPVPEKRKLPAFVKLKSRDAQSAGAVDEAEQPPAKAPRTTVARSPPAAPLSSPASSGAASPASGGAGLVAYDSDDED
mmetsp:Transcript_11611/g.31834  ORF Transcript_11611/g.31834 Transcript_11611/m.31834 type:complete len:113 (-) Transcript_11611:320-658(-)